MRGEARNYDTFVAEACLPKSCNTVKMKIRTDAPKLAILEAQCSQHAPDGSPMCLLEDCYLEIALSLGSVPLVGCHTQGVAGLGGVRQFSRDCRDSIRCSELGFVRHG